LYFTSIIPHTPAIMASSFPERLKALLGDVHSISKAKEKLAKHGKALELSGWYIDSDLRKRRQKLEVKILTILKEFQDQIEHRNWVKFIEASDAGHATLKPHIDELYDQMHEINLEYDKYVTYLGMNELMKYELEEKSETLSSALDHMKFTEKYRHLTYGNDYEGHQLRSAMNWNGWK